jgi:hypothetical protein
VLFTIEAVDKKRVKQIKVTLDENYLNDKMLFFAIAAYFFTSCKDDVLPKPSSQLRLEYPVANILTFEKIARFF